MCGSLWIVTNVPFWHQMFDKASCVCSDTMGNVCISVQIFCGHETYLKLWTTKPKIKALFSFKEPRK